MPVYPSVRRMHCPGPVHPSRDKSTVRLGVQHGISREAVRSVPDAPAELGARRKRAQALATTLAAQVEQVNPPCTLQCF